MYIDSIASLKDMDYLREDFLARKITIFSKHWWNIAYRAYRAQNRSDYWWTLDEKGYKARIKFLESIIKKLS